MHTHIHTHMQVYVQTHTRTHFSGDVGATVIFEENEIEVKVLEKDVPVTFCSTALHKKIHEAILVTLSFHLLT